MHIGILGPLEVGVAGRPVAVGGAKLRTLLVLLALDPMRGVSTDALVDALWEGSPPAEGNNALQSLVSRLRRALGGPERVVATPTGYRLAVPAVAIDAHRFTELVRAGEASFYDGDANRAEKTLSEALSLWRGPALADAGDAPFVTSAAARFTELRLAAVEARIRAEIALGRPTSVIGELKALVAEHPLRESGSILLMKALHSAGRPAEALAEYERIRHELAEQLGVDPSDEMRETQLDVLRRNPEPQAPGRRDTEAADRPRTNLRAALTSFVGRDGEVQTIARLLNDSRLVTLVGPGGAGKTRLASVAAAELADRYSDGVWLVELAPITDPADIARTVLGSLGLRESNILEGPQLVSGRDVLTRLTDAVTGKQLLMVLDNCEHLIAEAAAVVDHLLGRCPELRVVATSREPLAIFGEALCPVPSLGLPEPDADPATASRFAAVRLFAARASAARPGFVVDEATVRAVVEICRRLDGLPLAIELAAARLRVLPVDQVAARLDDRFRLLTGGNRVAMPRHRTLRAVVEWSWELLTDAERLLAERLSIFPAGATVTSAEAVCADSAVAGEEIPDLLGALTDKSLLRLVESGGEPRYRMLETIREYGVERLGERGELSRLRAGYSEYFLLLAQRSDGELRGPDQLRTIGLLNAERDNLIAALRYAGEAGDAATAAALGVALAWYWSLLGAHDEATTWLKYVLDVQGGEVPAETKAACFVAYAMNAAASSGDFEQIARLAPHALRLVEGLDIRSGHPLLVMVKPGVAMIAQDDKRAIVEIDKVMDHSDPWTRAMLLLMRSGMWDNTGQYSKMVQDLTAANAGFGAIGDRWGMAITLTELSEVRHIEGDTAGAIAACAEALRLYRELDESGDVSRLLVRLAAFHIHRGEMAAARAHLAEAERLAERSGSPEAKTFVKHSWAELARAEGDNALARRLGEEALVLYGPRTAGPHHLKALVFYGLALAALADGDPVAASRHLADGYAIALDTSDLPVISKIAVGMAAYEAAVGHPEVAARLLGAAAQLRGVDDPGNADIRSTSDAVRRAVGDDVFEAEYAAGRSLSKQTAMDLPALRG